MCQRPPKSLHQAPDSATAAYPRARFLEARFEEPSAVGLPLLPTTHRQDCEELRQNAIQLICGGRDHQNRKQGSRHSATNRQSQQKTNMPPCSRPSRVKLLRAGRSAALDGRCARRLRRRWSERRNGAAPARTEEWQTGCTRNARSIFPYPHGKYATDDSRRWGHSEVPPVERVPRIASS